jgi:hypothetical protein
MAAPRDHGKSQKNGRRPERPDEKSRFARAMARAEFGRFYWTDEAEQALRAAMKRKPKR